MIGVFFGFFLLFFLPLRAGKTFYREACLCNLQSAHSFSKMRLGNIIFLVAFCSFTAYYIYEPLPEKIEEKWKLMLTNCFFKTLSHLVRKKKKSKQTNK